MGRYGANLCLFLALAAAAAACSDSKDARLANPLLAPAHARTEIVSTLRDLFQKNDTIRVTNAMMSEPVVKQVGTSQIYIACVRYTAHGINADMVGSAERVAYFFGGHLNQLIPAEEGQCRDAAYKPFPELEAVCIGKGCR